MGKITHEESKTFPKDHKDHDNSSEGHLASVIRHSFLRLDS